MKTWLDRALTALLLWALGTGVGVGVYWFIWHATSCSGSRRDAEVRCGSEADWRFWTGWPILLAWSLLVAGLVAWALVLGVREAREEAAGRRTKTG